MASPFQAAGATSQPSEFAPLNMDRYITGLVTQRSPLRDAAVPYLYEKFYSAGRIDSLWDGLNVEISPELTLVRRPGHSVFNSQTFPPVLDFYDHRIIVNGVATVRTIADTAAVVYDATGPNTKTALQAKAAGDGFSCFQSVGNTLYFSTGSLQKKWMLSLKAWAPGTQFNAGDWIVDPNNNIQQILPQQSAQIVNVAIAKNVLTLQFAGRNPFAQGTAVPLAGLTEATFLNGQTVTVTSSNYVNGFQAQFGHADYASAADTGTASTGAASGVTGAAEPAWSTNRGGIVADGTLQWRCWGASIQNWGIVGPPVAPSVTVVPRPQNYPSWSPNTYYSTSLAIVDENGNIQLLTQGGTTGGAEPTWATGLGATTPDGTAVWTCNGTANWEASTPYALGDIVRIQYTYYVTVTAPAYNAYEQSLGPRTYEQPVTVTEAFQCTVAGASGPEPPNWSSAPGLNAVVADGSVQWTNVGAPLTWALIGAGTAISTALEIVDANGYLQSVTTPGKSGATVPAWNDAPSGVTDDNTVVWANSGNYSAANTGAWVWAFAYKCSIDGSVSTASPLSISLVLGQGKVPVLQGPCSTDPQVDTIVMFRTNQAGGILLYEDEFPMPAGGLWTYQDANPDGNLVAELIAPQNGVNNPPPAGITALAFHLNRIWAAVNNDLFYCTGPDITIGNGYTAWSVSNQFGYPDAIARLVPVTLTNGALLAFTASDVQAVFGYGTASSPFFPTTYAAGIGLLGSQALDIVGSTIYLFSTSMKVVSLDPSAGYLEIGQPIGDQFIAVDTGGINPTSLYSATRSYVTWHEAGSNDTALYVSDGAVGWFRYSPISSPESGFMWSPRAAIEGGTSAVRSSEIAPGVKLLLLGPGPNGGPILFRNDAVHADNGTAYANTFATVGSIQVAQSGELAELAHISLDSKRVGTAPTISLLLGEVEATDEVPFQDLERTDQDPPNLPASETLFNDRFNCLQNGVAPLCRHFQMRINWASEDAPSELLQHTVYGAKHGERKEQV